MSSYCKSIIIFIMMFVLITPFQLVYGDDVVSPPSFVTNPSFISSTETTALFRAEAEPDCTIYYVILQDGAIVPSAANVKNGVDAGDGKLVIAGSMSLTKRTLTDIKVSDLSASTTYDAYFVG